MERWLHIDLIVDTSASMTIWRRTVSEFRSLIEHLGAFRDMRTWAVNADEPHPHLTAFTDPPPGSPATRHSPCRAS